MDRLCITSFTAEEWCAYAPHFIANFKDPKRNHTTFTVSEDTGVWCSALGSAISAMGLDVPTCSLGITPSVGWEIKINDAYRHRENNVLVVYAHPSAKSQNYPEDIRRLVQVSNYNNYEFAIVPPLLTPAWDKEKLEMWQELHARLKNLYSELMYFQDHAGRGNKLDALENSLELGDWTLDEFAKLMCDITRKQHHAYAVVGSAGYANGWSPLVQQGNVVNGPQTDHVTWAVLGEENFPPVVNFMEILCSVAIVERLMDRHHANEARHVRPAYFSMWNGGNATFSAGLDSTWIMYQLLCKAPEVDA
ncbi:hypothetical protein SPFM8_00166 [Salmonella phage SPFM8]|nr:hypothetical protein SPFM8_00166 [Salmonella phage SPFM8]